MVEQRAYACKVVQNCTLPHLTTSKVAKVLAPFAAQNIHQHTPSCSAAARLEPEAVSRLQEPLSCLKRGRIHFTGSSARNRSVMAAITAWLEAHTAEPHHD